MCISCIYSENDACVQRNLFLNWELFMLAVRANLGKYRHRKQTRSTTHFYLIFLGKYALTFQINATEGKLYFRLTEDFTKLKGKKQQKGEKENVSKFLKTVYGRHSICQRKRKEDSESEGIVKREKKSNENKYANINVLYCWLWYKWEIRGREAYDRIGC